LEKKEDGFRSFKKFTFMKGLGVAAGKRGDTESGRGERPPEIQLKGRGEP